MNEPIEWAEVEGRTLWRWPEFIALARRLGIPLGDLTTNLIIKIPSKGMVTVEHTYFPEDRTLLKQEVIDARIEKLEQDSREVSSLQTENSDEVDPALSRWYDSQPENKG